MKKHLQILCAFICLFSILSGSMNALAAGYSVMMEPKIDFIDGKVTRTSFDETYEVETNFYPTPFYKGYSVVHNNVSIMPGMFEEYFDKSSHVVDAYGNKVDLGTYDSFGSYPFYFDAFPGEDFGGYYHPSFDIMTGVNYAGHIVVTKNGKGGLIDVNGNVIIPCQYDDLYDVYEEYGIIHNDPMVTEPYKGNYSRAHGYLESSIEGGNYTAYYNGLAVVAESDLDNAKVGIVDKNDQVVVPFTFDMITPCYDKLCWVLKDGKWGIISVDTQPITLKVDDEVLQFDQDPLIINSRTLVPVRAIFEKLGATVSWDNKTKTVTATRGDTVITMTVDQLQMNKNGQSIKLDVAPQIISERTLVPVRAVADAFNCTVNWDGQTKTIFITK